MRRAAKPKRYGITGEGLPHGKRVWLTSGGDWRTRSATARTWKTRRGAASVLRKLRASGEALVADHVAEVP